MNWRAAVALLAIVLGFAGCRATEVAAPDGSAPDVDERLIAANNSFAFRLMGALREGTPTANVFISPASIAVDLQMVYNGSGGETKTTMADVLALGGLGMNEINEANQALLAGLNMPVRGVEFSMANSLWYKNTAPYADSYLDTCRSYYSATVEGLDFTSPEAAKTIDAWVSDQTRGKITSITPSRLPPLVSLILVNAAYFKGEWSTPFEKRETSPGDFTLLDGTKKPLPMMLRAEEETDYHRGEGYQAVHLPYGNGRIGMIVMLPDQDSSLDALCEAVDAEEWGRCVRGMHETECTLKLPRFSAEYATSLKTDLTRLGMEIAFDPVRADFAAMQPARPRRWIHDVLHSTYLKVDEKGTEAAAATEVLMSDGEDPGGPRAVLVDRPFICAIRDTNTGAILFIGAIVDPGEA